MKPLILKPVNKMKSPLILLLVGYFAWSQAKDPGCSILGGNLKLHRGETFGIIQACLRFKCLENDTFQVFQSLECETGFRGAPGNPLKDLADNIKKGYACYGTSKPDLKTG